MRIFESPRVLLVSAFLGAALAWAAPSSDPHPDSITMTVTSAEPGVEFAIVSNGSLSDMGGTYRTPRLFRFDAQEASAAVVPVHPGESVTVHTAQTLPSGGVQSRSGTAPYHLYRFRPQGISASHVGRGELEAALSRQGFPITEIRFGDGVTCIGPDVFELMLQERFVEARARCRASDETRR